jgi:hypothetical protein
MPANSIQPELIERKTAAQYLGGISLTTLSRLPIPLVRIRRRVFYRKIDLENYVAKHVCPATTGDVR